MNDVAVEQSQPSKSEQNDNISEKSDLLINNQDQLQNQPLESSKQETQQKEESESYIITKNNDKNQKKENQQKNQKKEKHEPAEENEIRVSAKGQIKGYLGYAFRILNKTDHKFITVKATGNAIVKALILIELVKRRFGGLHQLNNIHSRELESEEPSKLDENEMIKIKRRVTAMDTILSKEILDEENPGYQKPEEKEQKPFKRQEKNQKKEAHGNKSQRGEKEGQNDGEAKNQQRTNQNQNKNAKEHFKNQNVNKNGENQRRGQKDIRGVIEQLKKTQIKDDERGKFNQDQRGNRVRFEEQRDPAQNRNRNQINENQNNNQKEEQKQSQNERKASQRRQNQNQQDDYEEHKERRNDPGNNRRDDDRQFQKTRTAPAYRGVPKEFFGKGVYDQDRFYREGRQQSPIFDSRRSQREFEPRFPQRGGHQEFLQSRGQRGGYQPLRTNYQNQQRGPLREQNPRFDQMRGGRGIPIDQYYVQGELKQRKNLRAIIDSQSDEHHRNQDYYNEGQRNLKSHRNQAEETQQRNIGGQVRRNFDDERDMPETRGGIRGVRGLRGSRGMRAGRGGPDSRMGQGISDREQRLNRNEENEQHQSHKINQRSRGGNQDYR